MKLKNYLRPIFTIVCCWAFSAQAQVDIVNNDTTICEGASFNIHANTNGRIPISIPLTIDDVYSDVINIGFPFTFYGQTYTQCVVSANGFVSFDIFNANAYSSYVVDQAIPGETSALNSIMSPFCDIDPSISGGSIDYSLVGVAPNRRFIVSFCTAPLYYTTCNYLKSSFQIILHETSNLIDMHIISSPVGLCLDWNTGHSVQGVQNADGTLATAVPGRNYPNVWTAYNSSHRFTPNGPNDYTVAAIPHAPVPDSLATIYWFAGGFQVGTGHDFLYSYNTSQQLIAMVTQCQDTTTDTINVTVEQVYNIVDVDSTNPTQCEASDGTITLLGFFPGLTYTVHYTGPLGNPVTLTATANTSGGLVITGLEEGNYTNFWVVSPGGCISNIWPSVPLYDPPVQIDQAIAVYPTFCQATDGGIQLTGLIPNVTYNVTYWYLGNPTTVTLTANGTGVVTIPNLTSGVYSNITATTANCTSNTVGPVTLIDPLPDIDQANPTNPTLCRGTDGTITLTGLLPDSNYIVHYVLNTVPFTIPLVADGSGNVVIPNLPAGTYTQITVTLLTCTSAPVGPVVLQNPPVTADFTFTVLPGCTEDTVQFLDNSSGSAYPFDYTWTFGDGNKDSVQNPMHIYAEQGTYPVKLAITDSVCKDSITLNVIIDHPLVANFTVDEDTICQGTQITFTDASTATPPVSYYWDFGNGETNGFSVPSATSIYPRAGDHTAMLVITDFIGCKDTAYKYIRVDSLTTIHMAFSKNPICAGEEVTVSATYADTGSTGVNWDFGDGIITTTFGHQIDHSYESAGVYTIHAIATGRVCPDVDSMLTLTVQPQPFINLGIDTFMCPDAAPLVLSDLINAGNPNATWQWRQDDDLLPDNSFSIVVKGQGNYTGIVTIGECSATDSVWVRKDCYIDVPNVFTPDGDNLNDYFFPRQWLSRGVTSFKFLVFNRWGQEIFSTNNIEGRGWDGKFNGVDQPQGVYVYVIDVTFKDGRSEHKQGNVTLLR